MTENHDLDEGPNSAVFVVRRRFRMGAAALVLSGILFATTPFLVVGVITPPDGTRVITVTSALNSNSLEWRVGMALAFIAYASLALGSFALYARLARTPVERWALAGLVVTVGSLVCYLPLLGVVAYVVPAAGALIENGGTDAMAVIDRAWTNPFIFLPFIGGLLWNVGVAVMGIAVWRSGVLSKLGGIGLVGGGLLGVPAFLDVVELQFVTPLVLAIGLVLVGASLWRSGGQQERVVDS